MKPDMHCLTLPAAPVANRARAHSSPSAAGAFFPWKFRFRTGRPAVVFFACTVAFLAAPVRAAKFTQALLVAESYRKGAGVTLLEAAWLAEASIGPRLLSGSTFRGRDLGGRFHIRSAIAFGRVFGPADAATCATNFAYVERGSEGRKSGPRFCGTGFPRRVFSGV